VTFVSLTLPIAGYSRFQMVTSGTPNTSRQIVAPLCTRHLVIQKAIQALGLILALGPCVLLWMNWKHSMARPKWLEEWEIYVALFVGILTGVSILRAGMTGGVRGQIRDATKESGGRELLVLTDPPAAMPSGNPSPSADAGRATPLPAAPLVAEFTGIPSIGEITGLEPPRRHQLSLARNFDGTLLFPDEIPFCLVCGGRAGKAYASRRRGMRIVVPLCRLHCLQAQCLKFVAWLSLPCYPVAIAALLNVRNRFRDTPLFWTLVVAALALIPIIFMWVKTVRGPVPALVALEEGGTRVVFTYPDGVPGRK